MWPGILCFEPGDFGEVLPMIEAIAGYQTNVLNTKQSTSFLCWIFQRIPRLLSTDSLRISSRAALLSSPRTEKENMSPRAEAGLAESRRQDVTSHSLPGESAYLGGFLQRGCAYRGTLPRQRCRIEVPRPYQPLAVPRGDRTAYDLVPSCADVFVLAVTGDG